MSGPGVKCPCCGYAGPAKGRACVTGGPEMCRTCPAPGECPNGPACIGPGAGQRAIDEIDRADRAAGPDAPGTELAVHLESVLATPDGDLTADEAAHRIHGCMEMLRALSTAAETQIVEWFWVIRNHHPDQAAFDAFVAGHGLDRLFAPADAWAMALAWDAGRRNRLLRSNLGSQPMVVAKAVRMFIEHGEEARIERLDESDTVTAAIVTAPPRLQQKKIRALVDAQRKLDLVGGAGTAPEPPPAPPGTDLAAGMEALLDVVRELDRLGATLPELLVADRANRARRERIPSITDLAMGSLERIADAAREAEERFQAP